MKILTRLAVLVALAFSLAQPGFAQTAAPAPKTGAMPADDMAKKAKAKECSAKADAQGLHGKARKEFREKCKKS